MPPFASPIALLNAVLQAPTGGLPLHVQENRKSVRSDESPDAHLHDNWELKMMGTGTMYGSHDDRKHRLRGPAVILIPPGCIHSSTQPRDLSRSLHVVSFNADDDTPALVLHGSAKHNETIRARRLFLSAEALQRWQMRLGCKWDEFLDNVMRAFEGKLPAVMDNYRESAMRFFLAALCVAQGESQETERPTGGLVEEAEAIMRREYFDPSLSVARIAADIRRTPTYLAKLFRDQRGLTVRQSLVRIRLERAHALLARGGYSVKEAAGLTGWRTPQYFSRCFRHAYGYSPSAVSRL
jgi:AraC-like DNA-binding protein